MLPLLIVLFGSQTSALMHCFLLLPAVGRAGSFTGPRDNASNQAMQPTPKAFASGPAGRFNVHV